MVAFLQKSTGSEEFHQIVDFLADSHIRYALTANPTIYASLIEQFWQTATVETVNNGEQQLSVTLWATIAIIEALLGYHPLNSRCEDGPSSPGGTQHTSTLIETSPQLQNISNTYRKTRTRTRRMGIMIPQSDVPTSVVDEAIIKEMHDGLVRTTTTASSLEAEQGHGNIAKTQTKATSSGPSSPRTSSEDGPRCHFTMGDIPVQARPERDELASTKAVYNKALITLTKRVKKLEKQLKHKKRRVVIDSSEDEGPSLDAEDSPKQGRMIEEVDKRRTVNLVKSREQGCNGYFTYYRRNVMQHQDQKDRLDVMGISKILFQPDKKMNKNIHYCCTQEMLSKMLSRKLEVDHENEMAFKLLREITSLGEDCWELNVYILSTVNTENLPQTAMQAVRNTNVIKPGMYRIESRTTQNRAPQLPQTYRNTNPRVSTSTGVTHRTNVSIPQTRNTQMKDKVVPNISQVKYKKTEVEDHHRISSISNQTKSVTECNDSLKSRTSNVNVFCATCRKCVFNSNHDACVSKYLNDVNARTKKPKNSKSYYRILYEKTSKAWKWWIEQQCPSGYKWVPKTKMKWVPKVRNETMKKRVSFAIDNASRITNVLKLTNNLGSNLSCIPSSSNSLADCITHPIHYLVQGNITINRVYYIEGLNYNLFSVGQFCDADLEVAFQKSTCFVRDLQGNDLLTDTTVPSQQELDLLFGPLYDEFFNTGTSRVNKSSTPTENFAQQDTLPLTNIHPTTEPSNPTHVNAEENNNDQAELPILSVHQYKKLLTDPEMCMFALTVSTAEPKNIKEAMVDSVWIEAMQEELTYKPTGASLLYKSK
ncbi:hypothetical protein Tco_1474281 [Tanacetum coccineum]